MLQYKTQDLRPSIWKDHISNSVAIPLFSVLLYLPSTFGKYSITLQPAITQLSIKVSSLLARTETLRILGNMANTQEVIATDGDVIFLVGSRNTRLQVHSHVLSDASPVFASMMGPHFLEGHKLRAANGQPVEIALPDDDAEAITPIFRALHRHGGLLKEPSLKEMREITKLVDKYLLKEGALLIGDFWTTKYTEERIDNYWLLLITCHELGDKLGFEANSQRLILQYEMPFTRLAEKHAADTNRLVPKLDIYKFAGTFPNYIYPSTVT